MAELDSPDLGQLLTTFGAGGEVQFDLPLLLTR
jgi:hypothetical protein